VTQKLYFDDAYLNEFSARVRESFSWEGRPAVVLDRTAFYPESGGQPADRGLLNEAAVLHVFEDGERIVHLLDREWTGKEGVRGVIDWDRRFDHMQQHSGQHVLSQCFVEVLGGETRSFHLGDEVSTLEIGIGEISDADLERVESRANDVVFEDREIRTYFVSPERISSVPLRRPPKKEGPIRVVEVSGFDYSACGGTHCRRTGEIGLIKIIRWDKIRNNLRFEFLCGRRAGEDYRKKNRALLEISRILSVHERDAASAVEKTIQESRQSRKKMRQLQEALARFEAGEMIGKEPGPLILKVWAEKTAEEVKLLALQIVRQAERAVLFSVRGTEKDHFIFACSEKMPLNLRDLMPLVMERTKGKGGGGPTLVEIVAEKGADLEAVLTAAAECLVSRLPGVADNRK
jgi:alanyl-tRNA synthetase